MFSSNSALYPHPDSDPLRSWVVEDPGLGELVMDDQVVEPGLEVADDLEQGEEAGLVDHCQR